MKKDSFKVACLMLRLKQVDCIALKESRCVRYNTPCCLFCQYLKECYSKSEFKKLHEISCKYDKKVYFCIRVRDELQKLIEGRKNG